MSIDMRLFIAIEFSEEIRAELEKSEALVRRACERGSFTRPEHFHLTLIFLGQVPQKRTREIVHWMDACAGPSIPITIGRLGRFKRREGDILWRQIEADAELFRLQGALESSLRFGGFSLEMRDYKPHLTLGRRAVLKDGVSLRDLPAQMPTLAYEAEHMTLMRSQQINGKLSYTPLHRTVLTDI